MNRLMKILRYEIKFPVWQLAVIVAFANIANALWPNPPWWELIIWAGVIIVTFGIPSILGRWMSRSPSPKPPAS